MAMHRMAPASEFSWCRGEVLQTYIQKPCAQVVLLKPAEAQSDRKGAMLRRDLCTGMSAGGADGGAAGGAEVACAARLVQGPRCGPGRPLPPGCGRQRPPHGAATAGALTRRHRRSAVPRGPCLFRRPQAVMHCRWVPGRKPAVHQSRWTSSPTPDNGLLHPGGPAGACQAAAAHGQWQKQ